MNKLIIMLSVIFLVGCAAQKYDEVVYDCGGFLVRGTEIPNSRDDLSNGVDVYFIYPENSTIKYMTAKNLSTREWVRSFEGIKLDKSDARCKEILRFYEK